jgi:hypothetical protein
VKTVTVRLIDNDLLKLKRGVTGSGGLQSLIRRMQAGIRYDKDGIAQITINDNDLARTVPYWRNTGGRPGKGGYQARLPIASLNGYLRSAAPLFCDVEPTKKAASYCYFKREGLIGDPARIKIGRGTKKRARTGRSTDNPRVLTTLLRIEERIGWDEKYFHGRFSRLRIRDDQEWFWPGDDLMKFIEDETARQNASLF